MEHTEETVQIAQRIQSYFAAEDSSGDQYYLPWVKLTETQKSWWYEAAHFVLNGNEP